MIITYAMSVYLICLSKQGLRQGLGVWAILYVFIVKYQLLTFIHHQCEQCYMYSLSSIICLLLFILWGCRDEYYAWGLLQIAKAVSFLNNDCKLVSILELNMVFFSLVFFFSYQFFTKLCLLQVHGNVCLASVVVTPTLDWKLHAFDVLSEFDGSNETSSTQMLVM